MKDLGVKLQENNCLTYDKENKSVNKFCRTFPNIAKTNVYIPPTVMYSRCHAREVQIKMADGFVKRADEIRIGDRLSAFGGKNLTVADVVTGKESEMFKIETADGNSIRVSGGHAMKVYDEKNPHGRKVTARHLSKGDKLMTPYGTCDVSNVTVEPYNDMVYNFTFTDTAPNYIEANGYWSGDFYAQNEKEKNSSVQLSEESQALMAEFKELEKQLKTSNK